MATRRHEITKLNMRAHGQPEVYAAALTTWIAAAIALLLRMVARRMMKMRWVWEDYLAVVAFVSLDHLR